MLRERSSSNFAFPNIFNRFRSAVKIKNFANFGLHLKQHFLAIVQDGFLQFFYKQNLGF